MCFSVGHIWIRAIAMPQDTSEEDTSAQARCRRDGPSDSLLLISSRTRARPYNSSCFYPSRLHCLLQPTDYEMIKGEGKETFSLHLPSPILHIGEGSEGKKHSLSCSIYAREHKKEEAHLHNRVIQLSREAHFSTSQLNSTTSELEKTTSEVDAPLPPRNVKSKLKWRDGG